MLRGASAHFASDIPSLAENSSMRLRGQLVRDRTAARAVLLAAALAALPVSSRTASAHSARFSFSATVTRFESSLGALAGALAPGDILTGTFAYDPHLADVADGPEDGHYREDVFTGDNRMSVTHRDFSLKTVENPELTAAGTSLRVQNAPVVDSFTFASPHVDTRPAIVGLPGVDSVEAMIHFADSSGTALDSDALPESLDLSAFDTAVLSVLAEDFAGTDNPLVLDADITSLTTIGVLEGDYNADEAVDQADLDLVLLNWGSATPPIPRGWVNDLPDGLIDQRELDSVLLNWGISFAASAAIATAVPEPFSLALALFGAATMAVPSRHTRTTRARRNALCAW
jgi:hypothetical protein